MQPARERMPAGSNTRHGNSENIHDRYASHDRCPSGEEDGDAQRLDVDGSNGHDAASPDRSFVEEELWNETSYGSGHSGDGGGAPVAYEGEEGTGKGNGVQMAASALLQSMVDEEQAGGALEGGWRPSGEVVADG